MEHKHIKWDLSFKLASKLETGVGLHQKLIEDYNFIELDLGPEFWHELEVVLNFNKDV